MPSSKAPRRSAVKQATRPVRSDGRVTREQILQTAGQVFAERGYAQATSKEICERAGTNMAAVNYHFGSRDGLYEAVLIEAHRQILDLDELQARTALPGDARERLRAVLAGILQLATRKRVWAFPVLLREMMSPSPVMPALAVKAIKPKTEVLLGLLSEVTGLPEGHPSVQRCLFFCIVPCMLMAVAPVAVTTKVMPVLNTDIDALMRDLDAFAFGGIDAVAQAARRR